MSFAFFRITVDGVGSDELSAFLRSHRVAAVRKELVQNGAECCWAFCVEYVDGPGGKDAKSLENSAKRIDYKEVLSPDDFAMFVKLREWRKSIAENDAVPAFTIFTNEQLAAIVKNKPASQEALREIAGIGESRASRYGQDVLAILQSRSETV